MIFDSRIRQHRKMNAGAVREALQHSHAVIADGGHAQPAPREFRFLLFQLDELAFAERSPVGRADEHQHQALRPAQSGEGLPLAVLIGGCEIGDVRADLRPGLQRDSGQQNQQALHALIHQVEARVDVRVARPEPVAEGLARQAFRRARRRSFQYEMPAIEKVGRIAAIKRKRLETREGSNTLEVHSQPLPVNCETPHRLSPSGVAFTATGSHPRKSRLPSGCAPSAARCHCGSVGSSAAGPLA